MPGAHFAVISYSSGVLRLVQEFAPATSAIHQALDFNRNADAIGFMMLVPQESKGDIPELLRTFLTDCEAVCQQVERQAIKKRKVRDRRRTTKSSKRLKRAKRKR
jgi:hypothetical protein